MTPHDIRCGPPAFWLDKPYYSLNAYCRRLFHEKLYKIALNAGMSCPNRDGRLDTRGCSFCSGGGSGEFAVRTDGLSIERQIERGLSLFRHKRVGQRFIAYFQAYTNTYAPVSRLRVLYRQALDFPAVAGISIATRPDCLPRETLDLLSELKRAYPDKFIWIELGLQTIHEKTAAAIRFPALRKRFSRWQKGGSPLLRISFWDCRAKRRSRSIRRCNISTASPSLA